MKNHRFPILFCILHPKPLSVKASDRFTELSPQRRSYLAALAAILLWSTIAVAFKTALQYLDPVQLVFCSSLVSFVFFMLINLLSGTFKKVLKSSTKIGIARSALLGFMNPFLYYLVLIHAYDMIPAQEAMTLNYIWPLMLALLSVPFLHQKLGTTAFLAMILSFGGIILIATKGQFASLSFSALKGDLLAAGSSIIWALYWIFNLKDDRAIPQKMLWNFFFGTIFSFLATLWFSNPYTITPNGWFSGIYLGLFEMGATFLLWLTALRLSRKTYLISQLIFLAPFISLIWIRLVLKEPVLPVTIMGLVLIVAGILWLQWSERQKPERKPRN